jgi:molybdate transport system permease protein
MTFPPDFFKALWLIVSLASASTLLLLIVGVPVAQWLVRAKGRIPPVIEAVLTLPIVLPPAVIGFYLVMMGRPLAFSFPGLLAGAAVYSLPFAIHPFRAGFSKVPVELLDMARVNGVPAFETFWRVTLPLARSGITAGVVLSFAHTLGAFGALLPLGRVIAAGPGGLPVALDAKALAVNHQEVLAFYPGLLALAFLLILGVTLLNRREAA